MKPDAYYRTSIVETTLKLSDNGESVVLDFPYTIYGYNIIHDGKDITYRLNDLSLDGATVIAKVDYEKEYDNEVKKLPGYIGKKAKDIIKHLKYSSQWSTKKKDYLATYDEEGTKIEYDSVDKEDLTQFCAWEED